MRRKKKEKTLEQLFLEASQETKDSIVKKLKKQVKKEIKSRAINQRIANKELYDMAPDQRTQEQKEESDKVYHEIEEYLKDKFIYSKYGNKLYPKIYWSKRGNVDVKQPFEPIRVIEKEVVKPNKTYSNYMEDRDPVPEEVIIKGFREILSEYLIDHLDDFNVKKLFYHIILSIAHYLDMYPEFYLALQDIHIYREPLKRNVFTVVIPEYSYKIKEVTIDSLYQYFVGGDMEVEALNKTFDLFALSFIEYTEVKKSLTEKARESARRYELLRELTEKAKEMLRAQGITGGPGYRKLVKETRDKLRAEHRKENSKHVNKKYLTNNESHDIIEENKEDTTK